MADMKLNAEVLLRIDGHDELHSIGTIEVPINVTFGDKPTLGPKPGYRGVRGEINVTTLARNITRSVDEEIRNQRGAQQAL